MKGYVDFHADEREAARQEELSKLRSLRVLERDDFYRLQTELADVREKLQTAYSDIGVYRAKYENTLALLEQKQRENKKKSWWRRA